MIKDPKSLSDADKNTLAHEKCVEIDFLLKEADTPIPLSQVPDDVHLQILKRVLALKTNSKDNAAKRHRARLVSAPHLSAPRHSVHGNAPTVMLSTIRMLLSVFPTWMKLAKNEKVIVFPRDVIKAFLQSLEVSD